MICCKTNTVCPKCHHEFPVEWKTTTSRRGWYDTSGGITTSLPTPPSLQSPELTPEPAAISFIFSSTFHTGGDGGGGRDEQQDFQLRPPSQVVHVIHQPLTSGDCSARRHHHQQPPAATTPPRELGEAPSADIVRALRLSGWYYEGITYQDSQELLKHKQLGTFLVRDSSDRRFFYTLSVQTERGPTSVRIHFARGRFRLDSQEHIQAMMPSFASVIELVEHYVEQSHRANLGNAHVWVDPKGKMYSPIMLTRPLVREAHAPPTLRRLARLAVNAAIRQRRGDGGGVDAAATTVAQLELPASVRQYLTEYPYSI